MSTGMDSSGNKQSNPNIEEVRYGRVTKILFGISVVVFIITLSFYIINFWGAPLSSQAGDWGTFGDYLGGVLNPIVGLINMVFVMLTLSQNHKALTQNAEEIRLATNETRQSREAHQGMLNVEEQNLSDRKDLLKVESLKNELDVRLSNLEKELNRKQLPGGDDGVSISDVVGIIRIRSGTYNTKSNPLIRSYYKQLFNKIISINERLVDLSTIDRALIGQGYQYRIEDVMDDVYGAVLGFSYVIKPDDIKFHSETRDAWDNFCAARELLKSSLGDGY